MAVPAWLIKMGAQVASAVPALWLKDKRQEDWMRGIGAFWGGVEQKKQAREQAEQRDALAEYYKERAKSLEAERKAEEKKAELQSYRATRSPSVGRVGTPSMINRTQIGGDVSMSPQRLDWMQRAMGQRYPNLREDLRPPLPAAPPIGGKAGEKLQPGDLRRDLFRTDRKRTPQETLFLSDQYGMPALTAAFPEQYGKPPTAKPITVTNTDVKNFLGELDPSLKVLNSNEFLVGVNGWLKQQGQSPIGSEEQLRELVKQWKASGTMPDIGTTGTEPSAYDKYK